jgi:hypothetical protein
MKTCCDRYIDAYRTATKFAAPQGAELPRTLRFDPKAKKRAVKLTYSRRTAQTREKSARPR